MIKLTHHPMKNTKKHQIFRTIFITSIVLASAVLQAQDALAQAVYQQTCKLGVFPYSTSGTYKDGDAANPYINFLTDSTCKNHLLYPQAHNWTDTNVYNVKPPSETENTINGNAITIHAPISNHSHAYFNDTPEDSTYYTKSFTDQFEIQIQSDAWDNIYLDQISCDITVPDGYAGDTSDLLDNCEGSSPLFGGTTATKSFDYGKKTLTINFRFAPPGGNGRPTLYGKNGNGFVTYKDYNNDKIVQQASEKLNTFDVNGFDPYSHELEFAVNLPTKDAGTIWSATTTSRALIRNLALKRTHYWDNFFKGCIGNDVNNADSGWCYKNVLPGYQIAQVTSGSGTYDYFWYPIGSVANIWRKPPPQQSCNSFQISPITLTEADLPKTINITNVSTTGGLLLDYKWTADNTGGFISFDNDPAYTGNARFTSATSVTIKKVKDFTGTITVYVNAVKKGTTAPVYTGGCQQQLTLTKSPKDCVNLTLNPTGPFTSDNMPKTITATSTATGGLQLVNKWTASDVLSTVRFDDTMTYTGSPYFDPNNTTKIALLKAITSPVTVYVTAADATTHQEYPGINNVCKKQIVINPTPVLSCNSLTIYRNNVVFPNSINYGDPTDNLYVQVSKDAALNLDYRWSATQGLFNNTSNPLTTLLEATKVNYSGASQTAVTTVKVDGYDETKGPNSTVFCSDQFNIAPPPTSANCSKLNPTVDGSNSGNSITFNAGTIHTLAGDPSNTDQTKPAEITWSETGPGYYTAAVGNPPGCPTPVDNITFDAPTSCKYVYHADPNGQGTASFEAKPNNGGIAACKANISVTSQPPSGQCENINASVSPSPVHPGDAVTISINPTYSGNVFPDSATWTENGSGSFTGANGGGAQCQINPGLTPFTRKVIAPDNCKSYNYTAGAAGDTVTVSALPYPNVNQNCIYNLTVQGQTINASCSYAELTPSTLDLDGTTNLTATVHFDQNVNGQVTIQWSGDGTFDLVTPQNTQTKTITNNNSITFTTVFHTNNIYQSQASFVVTQVPAGVNNSYACSGQNHVSKPPEKEKCEDLYLDEHDYPNYTEVCAVITGQFDGLLKWVIGNVTKSTYQLCQNVPQYTFVSVYATDKCKDSLTTKARPPRAYKGVRQSGKGSYVKVISIPSNQKDVDYQLTFEADRSIPTSARITDTISQGFIDGITQPTDTGKGHIQYVTGSTQVNRSQCTSPDDTNCWMGEIGTSGGVRLNKVTGTVIITYKGKIIDSAITPAICVAGKVCEEIYKNQAKIEWWTYDQDNKETRHEMFWTEFARVQIFCQYILTRAAGDIYMESDFTAGVDIRQCSKYTSTPGLIIVPTTPENPGLSSTGNPSQIFTINHEICTEGQAGTLPGTELNKYYGQTVSNLSSQICEVKLQPGTGWQQTSIVNSIEENKTRISRWDADFQDQDVNMTSIKMDADYANKNVYRISGGDLTIDQPYTLSDGEGAKTFIVENGNLHINSNILYGACNQDVCTVNDTASLAFIVLNGNVYVDRDVTEMDGVYFVQAGTTDNGKLFNSPTDQPSEKQLVILGSVYGDIQPLFIDRLFAGDPALEEAGILIRFDERIILNTPPGLRDVLSFSQGEVAR